MSPRKAKTTEHTWGKWSKWSAYGARQEKSSRRCSCPGNDCPGATQTTYRDRIADARG